MISNELSTYISQARAAGMANDAIRKTLLDSGWDAMMVNEALPSGAPVVPAPAKPGMPPIAGVAASGTAPAGIAYSGYWRKFFAIQLDGCVAGLPLMVVMTLYAVSSFGLMSMFSLAHPFALPAVAQGTTDGLEYATAIGLGTVSGGAKASGALFAVMGLLGLLSVVWIFFYTPFYMGRRGATPGMRWRKIRAVREKEPGRIGIGFGHAFAYMLLQSILGGLTGGLTYHWQLIDPRRQDVAAKILKIVIIHDPAGVTPLTSLAGIPERGKRWVWFLLPAPIFIFSILALLN